MSIRVSYKLSAEQWKAAYQFSQQIGAPLETIAKQALFWSIEESFRRAKQLAANAEQRGVSNESQGNAVGDTTTAPASEDTNSTLSAEPETSGVQAPSGG